MAIKLGAWHQLMRGFSCHVLRQHDWKRAVRLTAVSGTQTCRRCGAKRPVLLRSKYPASVAAAREHQDKLIRRDLVVTELPASQWPSA